MNKFNLRSLCAVLALGFAATACNRQDNPPNPPKSLASSQGTSSPDVARPADTPPLPSGTPPAAADTPAPSAPQERGMGGVAGSTAGTGAGSTAGPGTGATAAAGAGAGAGAAAGSAAGPSTPTAGPVAGADRAFVSEAANSGLAEVEAARLIAARTDNANVRSLAQHMEREHASTNDELKRIASDKGIEIPSTIGGEPRGQLSRLTTLSKPEVDQAFVRDFGIDAHRKAISLFERQAREGQDPELKAFAERTLPKLREHLNMAQQMAGQAGVAGPAGNAPR